MLKVKNQNELFILSAEEINRIETKEFQNGYAKGLADGISTEREHAKALISIEKEIADEDEAKKTAKKIKNKEKISANGKVEEFRAAVVDTEE